MFDLESSMDLRSGEGRESTRPICFLGVETFWAFACLDLVLCFILKDSKVYWI